MACRHNWHSVTHREVNGIIYKIYTCLIDGEEYKKERDYTFRSAKV